MKMVVTIAVTAAAAAAAARRSLQKRATADTRSIQLGTPRTHARAHARHHGAAQQRSGRPSVVRSAQ